MGELKVNQVKTDSTNSAQLAQAKQKIAKKDGEDLASNLAGYTTKTEQKQIEKIIQNTDSKYLNKLLAGYDDSAQNIKATKKCIASGGQTLTLATGLLVAPEISLAVAAIGGAIFIPTYYSGPDAIFEQINSEYNFPKKKEVMMDLAKKCHEYLKNEPKPNVKTTEGILRLETIINKGEIQDSDIENLDKIAKSILKK